MRNSRKALPSVLLLLIVVFSVALSAAGKDTGLYHRSPNSDDADSANDDFSAYTPDRWRFAQSQIVIRLLESYASRNKDDFTYGVEYTVTGTDGMENEKNFGNALDENAKNDQNDRNEEKFDGAIPMITSRTIIDPPAFECPAGQKPDSNGQCREVIEM